MTEITGITVTCRGINDYYLDVRIKGGVDGKFLFYDEDERRFEHETISVRIIDSTSPYDFEWGYLDIEKAKEICPIGFKVDEVCLTFRKIK